MPTLQDVAKLAGVSTATVSKVLSNTPYFTEETRDKVLRAVEELGYLPNLAARALSSGKTHIISVVFPYVYDAIFQDPMVMSILEGIEQECTNYGYNLLLSTPRLTNKGPDEVYQKLVQSGYMDGIIALDNVPQASVIQPATARGIPCVVIGYHQAAYYVRSDDYSGGQQLMEHMIALGHNHIGIITVMDNINFSIMERIKGLKEAAQHNGLDFNALPVAYGDFSVESGGDAIVELLAKHPHLTAIIALNDRMAMGAIRRAIELGRHVPEDLSIAGYDDIPSAAIFSPPLTTISQQGPALGRASAQLLFALLSGDTPTSVTLPVYLIERHSTTTRQSS